MTATNSFESAREREELCSLLIARLRDYAICMVSPQGDVMSWNDGARLIMGYTRDEIVGRPISVFYTPEDAARARPAELLHEAVEKGRVEDEGWRVRKDGSRFWANVVITALRDTDGHLTGFAKVTRDLTERRRTEAAIEELSGRLFLLQDEERKRLAAQLHDRTSTPITAAVATLYRLREQLAHRAALGSLNEAIAEIEGVGDEIRRIAYMLHPSRLEQSGLVDTLRWYTSALAEQMGLAVEAKLPDKPVPLPKEGEIVLFRLVQECLSRIVGPDGARSARVQLAVDGDATLEIRIEGAARGPSLDAPRRRRSDIGSGFAGLRDRLRRIGGTLTVTSDGQMSIVQARVPVRGA